MASGHRPAVAQTTSARLCRQAARPLRAQVEIDVAAFEKGEPPPSSVSEGNGGVTTPAWASPLPSLDVETTLPDYDEYEVRVYDATRGRTLVAAIELVSPANKDRPE